MKLVGLYTKARIIINEKRSQFIIKMKVYIIRVILQVNFKKWNQPTNTSTLQKNVT